VPVTLDNFNRAETDMIFADSVKTQGLGKFLHHREPMAIDLPIVRPNRDTLYSLSVFDLDAGPLTITLPNAGQRFMSMQVIEITAKKAADGSVTVISAAIESHISALTKMNRPHRGNQ
jgi:hypothetical protein